MVYGEISAPDVVLTIADDGLVVDWTWNDAAEEAWVQATFGMESFWIGFHQQPGSPEPDGGWTWISGEPVTYTDWFETEPNDTDGIEDVAAMNQHWGTWWNDLPDFHILRGVVEHTASP